MINRGGEPSFDSHGTTTNQARPARPAAEARGRWSRAEEEHGAGQVCGAARLGRQRHMTAASRCARAEANNRCPGKAGARRGQATTARGGAADRRAHSRLPLSRCTRLPPVVPALLFASAHVAGTERTGFDRVTAGEGRKWRVLSVARRLVWRMWGGGDETKTKTTRVFAWQGQQPLAAGVMCATPRPAGRGGHPGEAGLSRRATSRGRRHRSRAPACVHKKATQTADPVGVRTPVSRAVPSAFSQ
jgi:hypothetical protein